MGREGPRTEQGRATRLREIAVDVFGWDTLPPEQLTAVERLPEGEDTLVVMPTGAGKSAVYRVPALTLCAPVVVVSPLPALQRDRIADLPDGDRAPAAVAVNRDLGAASKEAAWGRCVEARPHSCVRHRNSWPRTRWGSDWPRWVPPGSWGTRRGACPRGATTSARPPAPGSGGAPRGRPPVPALTETAATPVRNWKRPTPSPRERRAKYVRPPVCLPAERHAAP
ncbi:DEAD/DEAH box helicase [Streptomyces sp. GD-15H]|uniref:DEAD/DEAH box helicase n=1 Tax=Streptomyces sp. GD-15H TaxID=3129112 RepID=UPI00324E17DC